MTSDAASTMKVRSTPLPVSTGFCEAGFMILGWIEWPISLGPSLPQATTWVTPVTERIPLTRRWSGGSHHA